MRDALSASMQEHTEADSPIGYKTMDPHRRGEYMNVKRNSGLSSMSSEDMGNTAAAWHAWDALNQQATSPENGGRLANPSIFQRSERMSLVLRRHPLNLHQTDADRKAAKWQEWGRERAGPTNQTPPSWDARLYGSCRIQSTSMCIPFLALRAPSREEAVDAEPVKSCTHPS